MRSIASLAGLAALALAAASFPARAQQSAAPANTGATATYAPRQLGPNGVNPAARPNTASTRNPVLTDNGYARASRILGQSVYNDHFEKVGTAEDILIGRDGHAKLVLKVGGIIGIGSKLVTVPFAKLAFGNTLLARDQGVKLPGYTPQGITKLPEFSYTQPNGAPAGKG